MVIRGRLPGVGTKSKLLLPNSWEYAKQPVCLPDDLPSRLFSRQTLTGPPAAWDLRQRSHPCGGWAAVMVLVHLRSRFYHSASYHRGRD